MGYSFNPQKKRLEICKALSCRTIEIACLVNVGITNRSCRESLRYRNYVPIINFVAMIQFDSFFFWNFLIHKTLELKYRLPKTNLAVFPLQMNQILIPELKPCCFKWFWWNKGTHPTPHSAWSWKFDSKHPSSKRNQRLVSLASWVDVHSTKTWKMTYENHLTMKVVYIWYLQPIKGSFYLYIYIYLGDGGPSIINPPIDIRKIMDFQTDSWLWVQKKNIFQFSGVSNFFCTKNYPIFWLKVSSQSGFLLGQKDPFSGGVAYLSRNLCQDGRFNLFGFGQSCWMGNFSFLARHNIHVSTAVKITNRKSLVKQSERT